MLRSSCKRASRLERNKHATNVAPGLTTRKKKLLGARASLLVSKKGITTSILAISNKKLLLGAVEFDGILHSSDPSHLQSASDTCQLPAQLAQPRHGAIEIGVETICATDGLIWTPTR